MLGMTTPELAARPLPDSAHASGSPGRIRHAAQMLMSEIREGSVDADGFASNVQLALEAMGVQVPPMFAGMIGNALRSSFDAA